MLNYALMLCERGFAYLQGKGAGAGTVGREFAQAVKLYQGEKINLCVDIGGNKGTYTQAILAKFPEVEVVVFEPSKTNLDILDGLFPDNNVTIEPFAVSDHIGSAELFSNEAGSGLASLTKRNLEHYNMDFEVKETVNIIRFEDYWKEKLNCRPIDICKIDIEGHELAALNGFGEALEKTSIIQFEFGGCNIDTRTYFQDFWYFFKERNFELFRISPLGPVLVSRYREVEENFNTTNYIARRKVG